jgi:hypothetical protein
MSATPCDVIYSLALSDRHIERPKLEEIATYIERAHRAAGVLILPIGDRRCSPVDTFIQ